MGCLKITYNEEEPLAKNWKIFVGGVEKKVVAEKNRINYYTGGSIMPGRSFSANAYRYGFNAGSEKDDEITGVTGAHFTTLFREADTRLMRWWSIDPKGKLQPWQSPYNYMDANPILKNDPNGDICPWCIGALAGVVTDAIIQGAEIYLDESKSIDDFSFKSLGVSALAGATGVGLASKVSKLGKLAALGTELAIDASFSAANQAVTKGDVDATDVILDVTIGKVVGETLGKSVGNKVEEIVKKTPQSKALVKQADRLTRKAGPSPRPNRAAKASNAQNKSDSYVKSRGAAASSSSSNLGSKLLKPKDESSGTNGAK